MNSALRSSKSALCKISQLANHNLAVTGSEVLSQPTQSLSPAGLRSPGRTSLLQVILTGPSRRGNTAVWNLLIYHFTWPLVKYQESPVSGLIRALDERLIGFITVTSRTIKAYNYTFIDNIPHPSFSDNISYSMFTTCRRQHGCNCRPKTSPVKAEPQTDKNNENVRASCQSPC